MAMRRRLEALNTRFNALMQNRLTHNNTDEDNNFSQGDTIERLRMFRSNIPNDASATRRRQAARQSTIRLSFIENSSEHLLTTQRTTVKKIIVPLSMNERAFHQKIRETFPTMGEGEMEICRVDRRRRILPVQLSSVCPASIKACPEFGRSAVYVRLKDTSRLTGVQHENIENSFSGTTDTIGIPGISNRERQRRQMETMEQRRRQKIAERRMHIRNISEPEQGILPQFQYPDGSRKTRRFWESQPIQDLFAFAGSDNMASEVFSVQLAWSSNTILSTVDGSLSDYEISSPSTLYVLWMSGVQIEGLTASSGASSDSQSNAPHNLATIQVSVQSTEQHIASSPSSAPVLPVEIGHSSPFHQVQLETSCSPSTAPSEVFSLDSEDEDILDTVNSPVYTANENNDEVSAADILRTFQDENLDLDERLIVVARRRKILHSACTALKSSYFAWHESPQIEFVGESADDYGGPRREFFRLLMQEIESSFGVFEGKTGQVFFTYDQASVEMRRYYTAGKLIAWSLIHGGPGIKALDTTSFQLMCGQNVIVEDFDWRNLPDVETQDKVRQVFLCKTQEEMNGIQSNLGEWIADCGVPGIYTATLDDMRRIYGQVIKHYIYFRTADMINQFKDGMNCCGNFWKIAELNWKVFTNQQKPLTREDFRALFTVCWSEAGSNLREREENTIFCWELFLNKIQEKQTRVTFEEVLVFITGADSVPPLGFRGQPRIDFYTPENRRLPFASTCGMVLFLPRGIQEEEDLTDMLNTALTGYCGFGKI